MWGALKDYAIAGVTDPTNILSIIAGAFTLGSGSAATEVMLANGSNDLWAANTLQQAHDATDGATSVIGRSDFNSSGTALFSEGAQLDLDIDEVAGTAGTGPLTVHVIVVGN